MKNTRMILTAVAGLSVAALTAGAVLAQTRANVSNQPISIGADNLERNGGNFSISGRAEIVQGPNRLRADTITGSGAGNDQVETVTATGGVYYVTPTESIRGDRAVYTVSSGTVVVTGNVILTQGRNVLTGSRLSYNIDTGAATMAAGGSNGRIRGVFYPQGSGD